MLAPALLPVSLIWPNCGRPRAADLTGFF